MIITLGLTREGVLELYIETDKFYRNPNWALDWFQKNQPNSSGVHGFNLNRGSASISGHNIASFLNAYIQHGDDNCLTSKDTSSYIFYQASFNIVTKNSAKILSELIQPSLDKKNITREEFDSIKNSIKKQVDLYDTQKQACLTTFFSKHEKIFTENKNSFFGSWRKTEVQQDWSLSQILAHTQKQNNRSRKACVELGWMTSQGTLTETAPEAVKSAYTSCSTK